MKARNLLFVLVAGIMAASCGGGTSHTTSSLKNEADTASFYLGYMYGTGMQRMSFDEVNMHALIAGLNSAMKKVETKEDPMAMEMFLNNYFQKLSVRKAEENAEKGKKFLEENAKKAGVDTLGRGVQYKVITTGTGEKPTETDVVRVHYHGTLLDGTVFDSSVDRGEPAEFQLNRVIPGWTLALKEMPVGSKWIIYIPADMAYGPRGGGPIGPNETLTFEVELLEIVKNDEN